MAKTHTYPTGNQVPKDWKAVASILKKNSTAGKTRNSIHDRLERLEQSVKKSQGLR